ncbi:ATP-binding protein [Mycobacterium sp. ACS4331]|uniref:ATP-binding protein n=1 Tax=Mycobacterium sp. ACS4331 TaxID=1834121 RepID=UPI0007FD6C82|nr:ATP-binding protein [Mycobacterium sp. ACS4331]OBF27923.1 anti-sigma factor [Mycobacterium sp. ACS4331]
MTNAEGAEARIDTRSARSASAIEVRVAAQLENLAAVRTVIGAMGTFEDLDLDAVADLRLAVDEACTRLIRSAGPGATLVLVIDPLPDEVVVEVSTVTLNVEEILTPGSFSWHVLTSLTDDVRTFTDGSPVNGTEQVFGIALTTRRVSPGR